MVTHIFSAIPHGYSAKIITVESDANRGLPAFNIVGMANKSINEAKDRVRSAIVNSNFPFPAKKITINLAPANLQKTGTHLDLPIALAILSLSGQLSESDLAHTLFVGELSLNGDLRPIPGIINLVEIAKQQGFNAIYLPYKNFTQGRLIPDFPIFPVQNLRQLFLHLKKLTPITIPPLNSSAQPKPITPTSTHTTATDHYFTTPQSVVRNTTTEVKPPKIITQPTKFDQIHGQDLAKRALTIAIAGHHNLLLFGSPGTGKTFLAQSAIDLLPPLSTEESISLTKIYSLSSQHTPDSITNIATAPLTPTTESTNLTKTTPATNISVSNINNPLHMERIITARPFRSPHHTSSTVSIIGGGPLSTTGEISLAHKGILFLDELPEYPRYLLESLRQPLEDKCITISRANYKFTYPADFMLIATMNPCPCGYYGDPNHPCTCTTKQIQNYRKKLSGPLLDRIDISVHVKKVHPNLIAQKITTNFSTSNVVKNTITEAMNRQHLRFGNQHSFNDSLTPHQISTLANISPNAHQLLSRATKSLDLSTRSYFKVLKVARTIADLDASDQVAEHHLAEALTYRDLPRSPL